MKYRVQFQYRPKNSARPLENGQEFNVIGDLQSFLLIPNIGDHVELPGDGKEGGAPRVVEHRYFNYKRVNDEMFCFIKIAITDSDVDPARLMKV